MLKKSPWQAKQSILHTTVAFNGDCLKMWLLHHSNAPPHFLFLQGIFFFTKNNMTVVPHPAYFSLFPRLKIKLKGRHFDTAEVIEAESRAVLNTLTERF
jgi:hypothetical protein